MTYQPFHNIVQATKLKTLQSYEQTSLQPNQQAIARDRSFACLHKWNKRTNNVMTWPINRFIRLCKLRTIVRQLRSGTIDSWWNQWAIQRHAKQPNNVPRVQASNTLTKWGKWPMNRVTILWKRGEYTTNHHDLLKFQGYKATKKQRSKHASKQTSTLGDKQAWLQINK